MNYIFCVLTLWCNRDYPDFYTKLYALFQPEVFHVKYRAKFFKLANQFLRSTYVLLFKLF